MYFNQPENLNQITSTIKRIGVNYYNVCADNREKCQDSNYVSNFFIKTDSVDFGSNFNRFADSIKIKKFKGVKTQNGFKGEYIEYYTQKIPTSADPYDYIFIGTFELIKQ